MNDSTKSPKPGKPKPTTKKPVGRAKHVSVPPSAPTESVSVAIPAAAAAP